MTVVSKSNTWLSLASLCELSVQCKSWHSKLEASSILCPLVACNCRSLSSTYFLYTSFWSGVALDQAGCRGTHLGLGFLIGRDPNLTLSQIGQCLDRLSPLSTTPHPSTKGRRRGDRRKWSSTDRERPSVWTWVYKTGWLSHRYTSPISWTKAAIALENCVFLDGSQFKSDPQTTSSNCEFLKIFLTTSKTSWSSPSS